MANFSNKFLKDGLFNCSAGVVRLAVGVISIPALIRIIGVEEYGVWTFASSIVAISALVEAGVSTAATVFISQDISKNNKESLAETLTFSLPLIIFVSSAVSLLIWQLSPKISGLFFETSSISLSASTQAIRSGCFVLWARLIQQLLTGIEQAFQQYALMNMLRSLQIIALSVGMLAVAQTGGRASELMDFQAALALLDLTIHIAFCTHLLRKHGQPLIARWNWNKNKAILEYSLPMWLASVGSALFSRGDRIVLASLLGTRELGLYAAITDVTVQINTFSALPVQPLLPAISKNSDLVSNEGNELKEKLRKAVQINTVAALSLGTFIIAFAPQLLHLSLGDTIEDTHIFYLQLAALIYSLYSINATGNYILLAKKKVIHCAAVTFFSGFFSLLLISFLAFKIGLLGAIIGNAGYLLLFYLSYLGLETFQVSIKQGIRWILFPVLWFLIASYSGFKYHSDIKAITLIFCLEIMVFTCWFIGANRTKESLL